tara:strand:+ start:827 stop:1066 length:240 start_codon:yes stop_codon:yes gene_type:complete
MQKKSKYQIPSSFNKLPDDEAYAATIAYVDIMKENNYSPEAMTMIAQQLVDEALGVNVYPRYSHRSQLLDLILEESEEG